MWVNGSSGRVVRVSLLSDDRRILSAGKSVRVSDSPTGATLADFKHTIRILLAAYSSDDRWIVSVSDPHLAGRVRMCICMACAHWQSDQRSHAQYSCRVGHIFGQWASDCISIRGPLSTCLGLLNESDPRLVRRPLRQGHLGYVFHRLQTDRVWFH